MIQPWLRPLRRACERAAVVAVSFVAPVLVGTSLVETALAQSPTAPLVVAASEPARPTVVPAVVAASAIAGDAARTRFVIGLDKPVQFQVFSLSNPNRVVVELPDVKVSLPTQDGDKPVGLVKSFRGGIASADKMRIVIDVTEPVIVARSEVEKGKDGKARLALEIVPVAALDKAGKGKKPTPPFALGGLVPAAAVTPADVQPPQAVSADHDGANAHRAGGDTARTALNRSRISLSAICRVVNTSRLLLAPRYDRPDSLMKVVEDDFCHDLGYGHRSGKDGTAGNDEGHQERIDASGRAPADCLCNRPQVGLAPAPGQKT